MKIAVAIKQVPDTETKVVIGPDGRSINDSSVTYVVNPYDEYALEEALRIREAQGGGEVTVVTLGPARATQALRTCLAVGADKAVHVTDESPAGNDPLFVARVLAAVMKEIGPDLILTGKYAVGTDNQAVGVMLAELMGIPHVAVVTKLELQEGRLVAQREIEGALEIQEASLPCVICAQKGLNDPRYANLKGIMAAKKKPIESRTPADLGIDASAAAVTWEKLELPPAKAPGKILKADADAGGTARELVRLLHEEANVI